MARALRRSLKAHGDFAPADLEAIATEVTALRGRGAAVAGGPGCWPASPTCPEPSSPTAPPTCSGALRSVGLEREFQVVVVFGDPGIAVRKPDPRIFRLACERLGVPPHETLMIGDHLEANAQGAIAAGLQAL